MTDVVLPSLGESVTEGIVTKWLKAVGDHVDRDEPLYEISTDKVDSEMPSPAAGTLLEVLVAEGDTAAVGSRVAVIGEGSGTEPSTPIIDAVAPPVMASAPARPAVPAEPAPVRAVPVEPPAHQGDGSVTSPVVRRILEDAGVELSRVAGTGPGGTVTRRDAEQAVLRRPQVDEVVPPSNVRRRMAEHMAASVAAAPQAFVAIEADASALSRLVELGSTTADGVAVDPEAVVALAAVRALGEFELLNSTTSDDGVVLQHSVNLGVVIAVEHGMLVPVVHAAGGLTLRALARRIADLRDRTATRQLTTDDLLGATFTIAGAPTQSVVFSVPILISPQVAILSVGAVRRVLVEDGGSSTGVRAADRVILGCAFDHRVVEATYVSRFLERVGQLLAGLDIETER